MPGCCARVMGAKGQFWIRGCRVPRCASKCQAGARVEALLIPAAACCYQVGAVGPPTIYLYLGSMSG